MTTTVREHMPLCFHLTYKAIIYVCVTMNKIPSYILHSFPRSGDMAHRKRHSHSRRPLPSYAVEVAAGAVAVAVVVAAVACSKIHASPRAHFPLLAHAWHKLRDSAR